MTSNTNFAATLASIMVFIYVDTNPSEKRPMITAKKQPIVSPAEYGLERVVFQT